jgi:hypothetical protein
MVSGLLFGVVLSVCACWFHNMITLPLWLVSTDFGTWSYHCLLSNCTSISLYMINCRWARTLYHASLCIVLLPVLRILIWRVPLSHRIVYRVCIWCLFLFVIFLLHGILVVMPHLVLLLFHCQSLLADIIIIIIIIISVKLLLLVQFVNIINSDYIYIYIYIYMHFI